MAQDSSISEDLFFKSIVKCPSTILPKLLHHLVDVFCGHKNNYENYSETYGLLEWWDLSAASDKFFRHYQSSGEDPDLSALPQDYQIILKETLDIRNNDMRNRLIEKTHEISPAFLHDFDWKLKLALASDKMAQINEPRLLLDLNISGDRDKSLSLDLSKEELKSLISEMEKANKALQEFLINEE
ncbi:hypothetical protein JTE90_014909 [Oedothorax gibbosus]|uniref:COMM domain-containing protein n=1 Tax=Oedothorax gibbosus TaxID=931172 RepID=A0AAV6VNE4_9ARAC|nr:hypothetical protein JTE90_014909 [Oedothorax gibbosus]